MGFFVSKLSLCRSSWGVACRFCASLSVWALQELRPIQIQFMAVVTLLLISCWLCRRALKEARSESPIAVSIGPLVQLEPSQDAASSRSADDRGRNGGTGRGPQGRQHPGGPAPRTCGGLDLDSEPRDPHCEGDGAEQCRAEEDPASHVSATPKQGLGNQRRDSPPEQQVELILPSHAEPWVVARVLKSGNPQALLLRMAAEVTAAAHAAGNGPRKASEPPDAASEQTEPSQHGSGAV